ncbi:MAG TPA: RidA family protein [Patescibacteria group bacterium]|nr:RidA family protein [Patescibacteria group bacterium]
MVRDVPGGGYRFLPGIDPYSSGVVAMPGHQVVFATLRALVPWRDGFALIDRHLRAEGRPQAALCAIALRITKPLSFEGFAEFNAGYREQLIAWGLLVDGANPIARTNVAPLVGAPSEPSLYAFGYTVAGAAPRPTFVVAGSGEVDRLNADTIVRRGETSPDAIRDKAAFVVSVMHTRLRVLGADWPDVTAIDVYTPHPIEPFVQGTILRAAGPAAIRGVCWYPSHPPIAGLEYEMDLRGVAREIVL